MTRKPFIKSLKKIPIEQAHGGSGARRLLLSQSDPVSRQLEAMTKGYLKIGAKFDWHSHKEIDEFFLVMKGAGQIEFRKEKPFKYKPGDLIYIPAGIEHKIEARGKCDNEFFFIRVKT